MDLERLTQKTKNIQEEKNFYFQPFIFKGAALRCRR